LREKILDDYGNPTIKERVLDLITKLEKDSREMAGIESPLSLAKRASGMKCQMHSQLNAAGPGSSQIVREANDVRSGSVTAPKPSHPITMPLQKSAFSKIDNHNDLSESKRVARGGESPNELNNRQDA
jgi:hypothetical protein